jgi:hypothetical protein
MSDVARTVIAGLLLMLMTGWAFDPRGRRR